MRILHLTLKKKWFDMIASGEKREEYRELKDYWERRIENKTFDAIQFRNGYAKNAPKLLIELKGIGIGVPVCKQEWGATGYDEVYILKLGNILDAGVK